MTIKNDIAKIRRDYSLEELDESTVSKNPFEQFSAWMNEAIKANILDPSAMILATSNKENVPSLRTVLLKGVEADGFIFYTNYESRKASELNENPKASILFFWKEFERQIRISGMVEKISTQQSEEYFRSRPYDSQLGAWASNQSSEIPNRNYLERKFEDYKKDFKGREVPLPPFWGGYKLLPEYFEFWQGRDSRLHDRILFVKEDDGWKIVRLAP